MKRVSGLKRLIAVKAAASGAGTLTEYTATGNPATFTTNAARALKKLEAPFTPKQAGSGDPAPDNMREITGFDGVTVTRNGETVAAAAFGETVYGGTADIVAGTLFVEWAYKEYVGAEDEDWNVESGSNFYIMTPSAWKRNTQGTSELVCNMVVSSTSVISGKCRITNSGNLNVHIGSLIDVSTVAAFREWLAEHPLQVACVLTAPQTVTLTPKEIETLVGENVITTDTNGINTIKYLKRG